MSDELPVEQEPAGFPEYEVNGIGVVIAHEGDQYHVRLPDGRVVGYASQTYPSQENAAADIAHAIAHPPVPVPSELTRAQFIIAARRVLGMSVADMLALIEQLPEGEQRDTAADLFNNALTFKRTNGFLVGLASMAGVTSEKIDEVFITGAQLDLD